MESKRLPSVGWIGAIGVVVALTLLACAGADGDPAPAAVDAGTTPELPSCVDGAAE